MPITDLTNTKWVLNRTIQYVNNFPTYNITYNAYCESGAVAHLSGLYMSYSQRFDFYGIGYSSTADIEFSNYITLRILYTGDGTTSMTNSANDPNFNQELFTRIIEITGGTDVTNPSLISWLTNNATQVPVVDLTGTKWVLTITDSYDIPLGTEERLDCYGNVTSEFYPVFDFMKIDFAADIDYITLFNTTSLDFYQFASDASYIVGCTNSYFLELGDYLIEITGGTDTTNPDLIVWLTNNATYQEPTPPVPLYSAFNSLSLTEHDSYITLTFNEVNFNLSASRVFDINTTVENGTFTGNTTILKNGTTIIIIIPDNGYTYPDDVTVIGASKSYDSSTGVITLSNPTSDVMISAECEAQQVGPTPKASLSDYTWAEIKQLADLVADQTLSVSDLSTTYHIAIGDTKSSTINGETHSYRLIGLRHDVDASDNYLGMTFEQVDLMNGSYYMKTSLSATNASWNNSDLKATINAFTVASDLDSVITSAKKPCAYSVSSGTPLTYVISKLWVESETEVFNTQIWTIGGTVEGSQYSYYANGGSARKSGTIWWLRSPHYYISSSSGSRFACVNTDGSSYGNAAKNKHAVAPCFCI